MTKVRVWLNECDHVKTSQQHGEGGEGIHGMRMSTLILDYFRYLQIFFPSDESITKETS